VLEKYRVIVFDCDGVLLDSNNFKTGLFEEVLKAKGFPDREIEAFSRYQRTNFGISRYRLFQAVIDGQFGMRRAPSLNSLLEEFGRRCRERYAIQPETPDLRPALERAAADSRALYVVSGSDEIELREVLQKRQLDGYFAAVFGSPKSKSDNLWRVREHRVANGGVSSEPMVFIGDALADLQAATEASIDFVFMAKYSNVRPKLTDEVTRLGWKLIEDLSELS